MPGSEPDTVSDWQNQFQQTLKLMGERLDQVTGLYESRLKETEALNREFSASLRVFQDVIANLDKQAADLGRATAALIEIERRWALRLAEQQQNG